MTEKNPSFTEPQYRSGAVAQMLRMPVATLRVWERRYGLTQAPSHSGQRRYSAEDVRRLALVKQLTERGHAIGSLAALDLPQLQRVAATHALAQANADAGYPASASASPPARAWRVAVIGPALGARLQRPALLRRIGRPVELLGPFADAAQAGAALRDVQVDALLVHQPQLHAGWPAALQASLHAAAPELSQLPRAVLYGYAADAVCDALASAGTALLREPQPDAVLAQWLHGLSHTAALRSPAQSRRAATAPASVPARRWDDATLTEFAGRSPTLACECPRHVAELLMQLARFEAYSAQCEHRSPADAGLHAYLRQTAAASRVRFEAALEQVALHEGLLVPPIHRDPRGDA